MILSHQKFDLGTKCLIEKVIVQAPFRFNTNFQDEACFIYFSAGSATIHSAVEQLQVKAHSSVLLKCGSHFADLIKNRQADTYEIVAFHLYPDLLRQIYSNEIPAFVKPAHQKPVLQKIETIEIITKFIDSLYFYFNNPQLVTEELLQLKTKELVLLLIQTNSADSIMDLFADLFTPRKLNIKEVVNTHLFSNLTIADLAGLCHLSLSTFNRTFRDIFQHSPASYIRLKRIERAKELLSGTSLSISEIAADTCFVDVAHLSRSFKAVYNVSPTAFRKAGK